MKTNLVDRFNNYGRMNTSSGNRKVNTLDKFIISRGFYPFDMNEFERVGFRRVLKKLVNLK